MTYERPSPQDYEHESDYVEALEKWVDYQEFKAESADYYFESLRDESLNDE